MGQNGLLTTDVLVHFYEGFRRELDSKLFFKEGDRSIVRSIVEGFIFKRLCCDAVHDDNVLKLQELLACTSLPNVLNHVIDAHGNTLLHVAVRHRSFAVVWALLDAGADPTIRNTRGDLPWQTFMLPLLNK